MLPKVINNFLFEKSYIYDLVTLVYSHRRVSNIVPFSFTRRYIDFGVHNLDDRKSLYYGYFTITKITPADVKISINMGGGFIGDEVAVINLGEYRFDQMLLLANYVQIHGDGTILVQFIGYKVQMEDTDKIVEFHNPPTPNSTNYFQVKNSLAISVVFLVGGINMLMIPPGEIRVYDIEKGTIVFSFDNGLEPNTLPANTWVKLNETVGPPIEQVFNIAYPAWEHPVVMNTLPFVKAQLEIYTAPPELTVTLAVLAQITFGGWPDNNVKIFFALSEPLAHDLTLEVGVCLTGTMTPTMSCYGATEPGAGGDPPAILPLLITAGNSLGEVVVTASPEEDFSDIYKVVLREIVGITTDQIVNAGAGYTIFFE